jgi:protocatechuate 3,4-dioxygenase alpha subunit
MDLLPTASQTVGPFFHLGLSRDDQLVSRIAGPRAKGERLRVSCRILDGNGSPVNDALIEIWQADAEGHYASLVEVPNKDQASDYAFLGFGRMPTNEDGCCEFETIKPGRVPGPGSALQAPHLNVAIFGRGMLKQLFTRIYFSGDRALEEDSVLALVPRDRQETLMAISDPALPGRWLFDVRLQGDRETVFFDV